jgi:hypothetical protein
LFIKFIIEAKFVDFQLPVGQVTKINHFSFLHICLIFSQSQSSSIVGIFEVISLKAIEKPVASK